MEGLLTLTQNQLVIMPCPDPSPHGSLFLAPTSYRVWVHTKNLDPSLSDTGKESYEILLWPAEDTPITVIKQWHGR